MNHADLAHLCLRAYESRGPEVRSRHETDVLVEEFGNRIALVTRGTEFSQAWPREWSWEGLSNARDVLRDLRFFPRKCPASRAWGHAGFVWSAWTWFQKYRLALPKAGTGYVLSGHSLGAGIASHLARVMVLDGFQVDEVVLFGEPGGHYFGSRDNYAELGIMTTSYLHANDWIRLARPGRTVVEPHLLPATSRNPLNGHAIENYIATLAAGDFPIVGPRQLALDILDRS